LKYAVFFLVQVMQQAGVDGNQVVLLLEDFQFIDSTYLELVNSLLSAGEVPGLYTPEELEPLLNPLRDRASEAEKRLFTSSSQTKRDKVVKPHMG
jgi:dynein heavy chain 2